MPYPLTTPPHNDIHPPRPSTISTTPPPPQSQSPITIPNPNTNHNHNHNHNHNDNPQPQDEGAVTLPASSSPCIVVTYVKPRGEGKAEWGGGGSTTLSGGSVFLQEAGVEVKVECTSGRGLQIFRATTKQEKK